VEPVERTTVPTALAVPTDAGVNVVPSWNAGPPTDANVSTETASIATLVMRTGPPTEVIVASTDG
jgi:hypothetical protein